MPLWYIVAKRRIYRDAPLRSRALGITYLSPGSGLSTNIGVLINVRGQMMTGTQLSQRTTYTNWLIPYSYLCLGRERMITVMSSFGLEFSWHWICLDKFKGVM